MDTSEEPRQEMEPMPGSESSAPVPEAAEPADALSASEFAASEPELSEDVGGDGNEEAADVIEAEAGLPDGEMAAAAEDFVRTESEAAASGDEDRPVSSEFETPGEAAMSEVEDSGAIDDLALSEVEPQVSDAELAVEGEYEPEAELADEDSAAEEDRPAEPEFADEESGVGVEPEYSDEDQDADLQLEPEAPLMQEVETVEADFGIEADSYEAEEDVEIESPVADSDGWGEEAEGEADTVVEPVPDDDRLWYVIHCYSGQENKVRHNLEQRIDSMGMKDRIFDVVVPTEEEIEVKDGKRRTVERRVFPGYILVQMILSEESWYVVRNTPGVTGFVGMGNEPTPLRPEEVSQIIKRMEAEAPRIKVTYKIGQKVRIIDGPFNDFIGTVDNIDMERAKVRVMVSFFGRETPVELDFLQVEKA